MKFLANENMPGDAVNALLEQGFDVRWIRTDSPGITDPTVMKFAREENRIILTFDKDYGDLIFRDKLKLETGVILFRLKMKPSSELAAQIVAIVQSRNDWYGNFSVIDEDKIRMIKMPK